jgi:glycosyltransferase involved in cell wall biosynthesis
VYFVILGDGEQRAEIETAIHELGLENHIILPGSRKNVEAYLYAYDLFVSSSRWEGLPTVVMESMAAGVPVVATNIPGSRDLVQDGVTGWLVKPENSGALAEKILLALDSPAEQERFTTQALKAIQIYSIENVAAAYAALYQKLLSK